MRNRTHFAQNAQSTYAEFQRENRPGCVTVRILHKMRKVRMSRFLVHPLGRAQLTPPTPAGASPKRRTARATGIADRWARTPTLQVLRRARNVRCTAAGRLRIVRGIFRLRDCAILPSTARYVMSRSSCRFVPYRWTQNRLATACRRLPKNVLLEDLGAEIRFRGRPPLLLTIFVARSSSSAPKKAARCSFRSSRWSRRLARE